MRTHQLSQGGPSDDGGNLARISGSEKTTTETSTRVVTNLGSRGRRSLAAKGRLVGDEFKGLRRAPESSEQTTGKDEPHQRRRAAEEKVVAGNLSPLARPSPCEKCGVVNSLGFSITRRGGWERRNLPASTSADGGGGRQRAVAARVPSSPAPRWREVGWGVVAARSRVL